VSVTGVTDVTGVTKNHTVNVLMGGVRDENADITVQVLC